MMKQQVVITGIGMVTPAGANRAASWRGLLRGRRAVQRLAFPHKQGSIAYLGAPVRALDSTNRHRALLGVGLARSEAVGASRASPDRADLRRAGDRSALSPFTIAARSEPSDRLYELASRAADEAVEHSCLGAIDGLRLGCCIADSKGNLSSFAEMFAQFQKTGHVDALSWLRFLPGSLSSRVAADFGVEGPVSCPVAACATGLLAVIQAAEWIVDGRCDVALAGSADASLCPALLGSYRRLGVLAPDDGSEPGRAVRPFAADRRGFAVGEGAAVFVLESAEHARSRAATVLAELAGWHYAGNASNLVGVNSSPEALADCIGAALDKAEIEPVEVGHVNCHGTATVANDVIETQGIRLAFGVRACRLKATANKSMMGHLLGAAGSVELAATVLALLEQRIPPTVNLQHADPECDLDYTAGTAARHSFGAAVKLSFGFGGHAAAAVVKRHRPTVG